MVSSRHHSVSSLSPLPVHNLCLPPFSFYIHILLFPFISLLIFALFYLTHLSLLPFTNTSPFLPIVYTHSSLLSSVCVTLSPHPSSLYMPSPSSTPFLYTVQLPPRHSLLFTFPSPSGPPFCCFHTLSSFIFHTGGSRRLGRVQKQAEGSMHRGGDVGKHETVSPRSDFLLYMFLSLVTLN